MSDATILLCIFASVIAIAVAIVILNNLTGPGCSGDCVQGRFPCNCKKGAKDE